jgi:polysaccharide biosynthesis protein PslA
MTLHYTPDLTGSRTGVAPRRRQAGAIRPTYGMLNRLARGVDGCAVLLATLLAGGALEIGVAGSALIGGAAAMACVGAVSFWGGYRVERYSLPVKQALDLTLGVATAALAAGGVTAALQACGVTIGEGRLELAVAWTAALVLGRLVFRLTLGVLDARGLLRRRVAVVGAAENTDRLLRRLGRDPRDFELLGLFHDAPVRAGDPSAVGGVETLKRLAQEEAIDLIVLAAPASEPERLSDLCLKVQGIAADVVAPVRDAGVLARSTLLTRVAGLPMIELNRRPLKGTQGLVKRIEDGAVAGLALVLLSPVLLAAACAVRLSGPGPVLFRQTRVGFNGRSFEMLKFRSMTVDPHDDGSGIQCRNNPRITPVGALLRRTSLDELPQLINVLRGEMSVVGPRPHVANMRVGQSAYAQAVQAYAARHQIKPGITGWAQINGMRGGIDTLNKAERGVELDLFYIRNWSLQLDLRIMLRTVFGHMIGPRVF